MENTPLTVLMNDFGYRLRGNLVVQKRIAFLPEKVMFACADDFDAATILCPIINDPEYTERFAKLTRPTP